MHQHMNAPGAGRFSKNLSKSVNVSGANSFVEYPNASSANVPKEWWVVLPKDFPDRAGAGLRDP